MPEQLQNGEEKVQTDANEYGQLKPESAATPEPIASEVPVSADAAREQIDAQTADNESGGRKSFGKRYADALTDAHSTPVEAAPRNQNDKFLKRFFNSLFH